MYVIKDVDLKCNKINTRKDCMCSEFIMFKYIKICRILFLLTYKTKPRKTLN